MLTWIAMIASAVPPSPIKPDESVIFFPTWAQFDSGAQTWQIPVHGWIFEPEEDSLTRKTALAGFSRLLGLEKQAGQSDLFVRRARWFLVDNERDKVLTIRLGGRQHTLPPSEADGHFRHTLQLSADEAKELLAAQTPPDGWVGWDTVLRSDDERTIGGAARLIDPTGTCVISDIDDTIKISQVTDRAALLENTFLKPFAAVPGMAPLYQRWAAKGASFHYVTASPWQLYVPLDEFRHAAGFPRGTFHMRSVRFKDKSLSNLFSAADEHKRQAIEPIFSAFPGRKFILVGDSGEHDPEIFGRLARNFPDQIERICIRDVTDEPADAQRYQQAFKDVPADRWQLFAHPAEIPANAKGP